MRGSRDDIRFLAVLIEASMLLIFLTRSALAPSTSSSHDTVLEPYCTSLAERERERRPYLYPH